MPFFSLFLRFFFFFWIKSKWHKTKRPHWAFQRHEICPEESICWPKFPEEASLGPDQWSNGNGATSWALTWFERASFWEIMKFLGWITPKSRHGCSEYLRLKEHPKPVSHSFSPKSAVLCPLHRLFPPPLTASPCSLLPSQASPCPHPVGHSHRHYSGYSRGVPPIGSVSNFSRLVIQLFLSAPDCLVALFSLVTTASVCRELVRTGPLCDSMLPSIGHPQMSAQYTDCRSHTRNSPTGLCAGGL